MPDKLPRNRGVKVYVGGLPRDLTDTEFESLDETGECIEKIVLRTETGITKGCGFLKFLTHQAAQRAISALDKKEVRTSTDRDPFLIEARLANRESESAADDEHGRRKTERPL